MPTYEYQCKACGREFEYQQRMSDPDLTRCEACGEDRLEKLISRTAFQLKGGGWYKDLYASTPSSDAGKASGAQGRADKAASADGGSTASSSGDAGSSSSASSGGSGSGGSGSGGSSASSSSASGS